MACVTAHTKPASSRATATHTLFFCTPRPHSLAKRPVSLTNLVLAWNTHRMQETVERWRRTGKEIRDSWLARMGPAHFAHVNFRETFKFGVSRYAQMLLSATPAKSARLG